MPACAVFALALTGCGVEQDPEPAAEVEVFDLAPGYATGSEFTLSIGWSNGDAETGWTVDSADPLVAEIVATELTAYTMRVTLMAVGDGETTLTVSEGGTAIGVVPLTVATAAAIQIVDVAADDGDGNVPDVGDEVRASDDAWLQVRYRSANGDLLHGSGILDVATDDDSYALIVGDVLILAAGTEGTHDVALSLRGELVRTLRLVGVPATDVVDLRLQVPDESGRTARTGLCLGLLAHDAQGRRVFGPRAMWSIDGVTLEQGGERLCYTFAPEAPTSTVTAVVGGTALTAQIRGEEFQVAREVGCSIAAAPARRLPWTSILGLLGLLAIARARAR